LEREKEEKEKGGSGGGGGHIQRDVGWQRQTAADVPVLINAKKVYDTITFNCAPEVKDTLLCLVGLIRVRLHECIRESKCIIAQQVVLDLKRIFMRDVGKVQFAGVESGLE
jgi:hypothetical protein